MTATSLACFGGHWDLIDGARRPDWSAELPETDNTISDCQLPIADFSDRTASKKSAVTIGTWQSAIGNSELVQFGLHFSRKDAKEAKKTTPFFAIFASFAALRETYPN